jgi:hypothetical protein
MIRPWTPLDAVLLGALLVAMLLLASYDWIAMLLAASAFFPATFLFFAKTKEGKIGRLAREYEASRVLRVFAFCWVALAGLILVTRALTSL